MNNLLNLPEVQSAAAPLLIGLVLAALCAWKLPRLAGIAVVAGFITTALLVNGMTLTPLTATRKIILLAAAGGALGLLFDWLRWQAPARPWLFGLLAGGGVVWVTINYLGRQEGSDLALTAGGIIAYSAAVTVLLERLQHDSIKVGTATLALAIGTGGSAILGASALLGQLAFGAAAGAGAALLIAIFSARASLGSAASLGGGLILGLIASAATLFASMPWYVMLLLVTVPLVTLLLPFRHDNRFIRAVVLGVASVIPGAVAIYLTWAAAPQSLY